jgi:hypothetical protein
MSLTEKPNTVIIHYGCSAFEELEHTIYWVGAVYFENNEKAYFFENGNEVEIINSLKLFVDSNQEKTFIHWSMNSPKFGFSPIQLRYKQITGSEVSITPKKLLDLSEFLKDKYGIKYVKSEGGRLNNLATLNGFLGHKEAKEVRGIDVGTERLELIFSIYQAEKQGKLRVEDVPMMHNPYPLIFISAAVYLKFIEYTSTKIIDYYSDYSYLKKRLEHEKLTHNIKDNEFMRIVFEEMKFIKSKDYSDYCEIGKLSSLKKSSSANRENNFNYIFDK